MGLPAKSKRAMLIDDEIALRNAAWEAGINPDTGARTNPPAGGVHVGSAARLRRMAERWDSVSSPAKEIK